MVPQNQYYSEVDHLFNAEYKKSSNQLNMTSYHYHNIYEIYYFTKGERKFFYKDRIYYITEGDIILVNKFELHSMCDWDKPGFARILIDFKNEFFDNIQINDIDIFACFKRDIIVFTPNAKHRQFLSDRLFDIVQEFSDKQIGYETCIKAKMIDLLIFINRIMDYYKDKTEMPSSKNNTVSDIMAYINENFSQNLCLENIALNFGYSKNYLCTLFKKVSGFSIVAYINGVRVKKSQTLLKETKKSVTEIAEFAGFESITHFGRVFKQITGCAPLVYRKKVKWF